ncbi:hypothetical protein HYS48_02705 [Candidatus Woesearchaeota archaeon]|nr:hypothetical protein [Candidatus Woesearchaeota archaeon]
MPLDKKLIQSAHQLNAAVHGNAREYFHSRPVAVSTLSLILPEKRKYPFQIVYDIKDLFTIGAVTQSSILMTGGTDTGKTTLAKLVMNALFGKEDEAWHRIDVDTDFGKDAYADVDFSVVTEGKKLSEGLYQAQRFLSLPGLIWDEINRTHAALANKLLHVFDKDISLPDGKRVKIGHPMDGGETYQFQVAAINEGTEYKGTFDVDKALRRRTIIEIPIDVFSATEHDRLLIQKLSRKEVPLKNDQSRLETILEINRALEQQAIPIHPAAEMFVAYLEAFDFCRHSLSHEKGSVASQGGSIRYICSKPVYIDGTMVPGSDVGCPFLKTFEHELCPNVRGITPGISKNLWAVARGFALIRATKFVEMMAGYLEGKATMPLQYRLLEPGKDEDATVMDANLERLLMQQVENALQQYTGLKDAGATLARAAADKYLAELHVEIEDVEAAIGFVGYSKLGIATPWVLKHYQGNRYGAVTHFVRQAKSKFKEGLAMPALEKLPDILSGKGTSELLETIRTYCEAQNPWLWKVLTPYLGGQPKPEGKQDVQQFYA